MWLPGGDAAPGDSAVPGAQAVRHVGQTREARSEMGLGQYVRVGTASIWVEAGRKREWAACYGVNLAGG